MKLSIGLLILILIIHCLGLSENTSDDVGYRIGNIDGYTLLKSYRSSKVYQINSAEVDDGKPIRLVELAGDSHYQVGYDYGQLLAKQVVDTYNIFMGAQSLSGWQLKILEMFLDWQYDDYLSKHITYEFKDEIRGIQHASVKEHKIGNVESLIKRVLVISSYPSDVTTDIALSLLDELLRSGIPTQPLLNFVEKNLFSAAKFIKNFINKKRIHCSFFATWGNRTEAAKLYTMRNLDWEPNTGVNKYKSIFVWKIKGTIPHATLGLPGLIGALTGMSKAGLTVHQAGLDSMRVTQLGFQWTLRLRYILMYANSLSEAKSIWKRTNNTLGMNHMVASARDLATGLPPIFVVETMRNYTAWFVDNDPRENGTAFIDPKSHEKYTAGYSMKEAVFRTNHAYDKLINSYRTQLPTKQSDTMQRYFRIKDMFNSYQSKGIKINWQSALRMTAVLADKGGSNPFKCPTGVDKGISMISAMFIPGDLQMFVGFEYGQGNNYRTACCGVYLKIDMNNWFSL